MFNGSILPRESTIVGLTPYPSDEPKYLAFKILKSNGQPTHIHPSWVKSINGMEISVEKDNAIFGDKGKKRLKINSKYFYSTEEGLVEISTLPLCPCGGHNIVYESATKRLCQSCVDKATRINGYNFKPDPEFKGEQLKADKTNPVWYGIELEYGFLGKKSYERLMLDNQGAIYGKQDSSIRGGNVQIEVVSHPHSFTELMKRTSFINSLNKISVEHTPSTKSTNGCHVHISRTAFVDDIHYAKWYFLIHQMKDINEFIGGRTLTNYCSFSPTGKIYNKANKLQDGARSLMVNETNMDTIECRFFSSTPKAEEVKTYIQYLESLIKFTKYSGDTVNAAEWLVYVKRKSNKYKELISKIDTYQQPINQTVVYRAPVKSKLDWRNLTLGQIDDIVKIHTNGEWMDVSSCSVNRNVLNYIYRGSRTSSYLRNIIELEIHS